MEYFGIRQKLIVPNISWGMNGLHECDILVLSRAGYATEIEIKISKADLLKDKEKRHGHNSNDIANFYFCVPEKLKDVALKNIPYRAGLMIASKNGAWVIKYCQRNKGAKKWDEQDRYQLARLGTMRILGLKKKLILQLQ